METQKTATRVSWESCDILCGRCGRKIGEAEGNRLMIRHRGRTVRCTAPAEITCDKCGCVICVKRLPRKQSAKEN